MSLLFYPCASTVLLGSFDSCTFSPSPVSIWVYDLYYNLNSHEKSQIDENPMSIFLNR